jgi:hypothetical protein
MGDFTQTAKASQSPTGWAPTTKPFAHRVGSYKDTKHRAATGAKKGPLVAALFGLAGLVRLQHVLVNQQLR